MSTLALGTILECNNCGYKGPAGKANRKKDKREPFVLTAGKNYETYKIYASCPYCKTRHGFCETLRSMQSKIRQTGYLADR